MHLTCPKTFMKKTFEIFGFKKILVHRDQSTKKVVHQAALLLMKILLLLVCVDVDLIFPERFQFFAKNKWKDPQETTHVDS